MFRQMSCSWFKGGFIWVWSWSQEDVKHFTMAEANASPHFPTQREPVQLCLGPRSRTRLTNDVEGS